MTDALKDLKLEAAMSRPGWDRLKMPVNMAREILTLPEAAARAKYGGATGGGDIFEKMTDASETFATFKEMVDAAITRLREWSDNPTN